MERKSCLVLEELKHDRETDPRLTALIPHLLHFVREKGKMLNQLVQFPISLHVIPSE
ncbi:hypothetical protein J2T18_003813 [Paenibacillus polymyxa]|nr:hypothetical protein [Paenibacillus polymyxa]